MVMMIIWDVSTVTESKENESKLLEVKNLVKVVLCWLEDILA
jgi:hypothetical protein